MYPRIKPPGFVCYAVWMLIAATTFEATGFVEIQHPYYPALYVKGGEDFNLTCMGNDVDLVWFRTTMIGEEEEIKPTEGSEYEMTLIKMVPSMNVRNILVKKNARITDSGKYTCSDRARTDQYPIRVTVLYILTEFENRNVLDMSCSVAGFVSNLPEIYQTWSFNGQTILPDTKLYNISGGGEFMALQKSHVVQEDTGYYECQFTLVTNLEQISLSERMHFDASHYSSEKGAASHSRSWLWTIVALVTSVHILHVHT